MAITFEATYSKKLGLPNYSSHCFVVSLRTELSDLSQVEEESARLYALLQQSVDREVLEVGFLPDASTYGMAESSQPLHQRNGNGSSANGHGSKPASPAPVTRSEADDAGTAWNCTDKQRELILKLSKQAKLDWDEVEHLAHLRFDQPVRSLDRKQASGLIEALLAHRDEHARSNGSRARR
jgi:hypothetical protein